MPINITKKYDPKKWFFKKTCMTDYLHENGIGGDLSDLYGKSVEIVNVFENKAYLAHNHWIGVILIKDYSGDLTKGFEQFLVSVAAGESTALEKVKEKLIWELYNSGFSFGANKIEFDWEEILEKNKDSHRFEDIWYDEVCKPKKDMEQLESLVKNMRKGH